MTISFVKDLMIIIDFVISCVAASLKESAYSEVSDYLFIVSGFFLAGAVICITIEKISKKK